jgi:hypothetical protein
MRRQTFSAGVRFFLIVSLLAVSLLYSVITTQPTYSQEPDFNLLAPVSWGQTMTVAHGYNEPQPGEPCNIGSNPLDHCLNQTFGLDLNMSDTSDPYILAPVAGKIELLSGQLLLMKLDDGLNLSILHFDSSSYIVHENDYVQRGDPLGKRLANTNWVHISLSDRRWTTDRDKWIPIPFTSSYSAQGHTYGSHTLEGMNLVPPSNLTAPSSRNYYDANSPLAPFMSHNLVKPNEVEAFQSSNYQGGSVRFVDVNGHNFYNLAQIFSGQFNNNLSSIAFPKLWTVKLYKNEDKSGPSKLLTASVADFSTAKYDDGTTPLDESVSAIEVWDSTCSPGSALIPGLLSGVRVAEAACSGGPTLTPVPLPLPSGDGIKVVSVPIINVGTNQQFQPSITIMVTSGTLHKSSDFLAATPDSSSNKLGAYVNQGLARDVNTNDTYTFDGSTTTQFKMTSPSTPGTYYSYWRMWVNGAFKGPTITIQINVAGDPPAPDGWVAKYFPCTNPEGQCGSQYSGVINSTYVFQDWGIGGPTGTPYTDGWGATFERTINFPGGDYRFHSQHDDDGTVYIDGQNRLDGRQASEQDQIINLTPGNHTIKVWYVERTGSAQVNVWWQGPGFLPFDQTPDPGQWSAKYWGNNHFAGTPALVQNEGYGELTRDWHSGGLPYGFPSDNFSALYTRSVPFACGTYSFDIGGDDGLTLYIDSVKYGNNWSTVDVPISEGTHVVQAYYSENTGDAFFHMTWSQLSVCPPTTTPTSTVAPANTPTPAPSLPNAVTLLAVPGWTLTNTNGDAQASQSIDPNALIGRDKLRVTYNLHGLTPLGNDASAVIIDQPTGTWHYISLSNYGTKGLDGVQTVDIPLSAFPGLNLATPVGTLHTRFWYSGTFTVDIISIVAYGTAQAPTNTPTATTTRTPTPPPSAGEIELLTGGSMHLARTNGGDDQAYQSIPSNVLVGMNTLRLTYDLHGLTALGNDASAIVFDQPVNGDWRYISLSTYGQNGKNGIQTVDIPLSAFSGLNLSQPVGDFHVRFWYGSTFTVDIISAKVLNLSDGSTSTPTATPTRTPTPTATAVSGATTLLAAPGWHLARTTQGSAEASTNISANALQGKTTLTITYNLHGLTALGGDASAIIFDQGGSWRYISLSNFGTTGLNGQQMVDIPLSAFTGLNPSASVGTLHTRFWNSGPFTVDIISIVAH